jgi:hypothetical protein
MSAATAKRAQWSVHVSDTNPWASQPARSVDPTPLCTSSNPKKALAAAHKEAALFQVEGLDDLAPLAATAPPGVPDLPEGDIIALGDEVGGWGYYDYYYYHYCVLLLVSGIIMIIIIITIVIIKGVAAHRWHWGGGHRTVAAALAEAPKAGAQFRSPRC